jgi:hypothetical protein
MFITIAPDGILQIDDARIVYRNFAGVGSKFNREGDRNFSIVIPDQETADRLLDMGYNVKTKPPREDGDEPFRHLPVKIKFTDRGPAAYLRSGEKQVQLTEDTIDCLDEVDIASVELDVRPYDWEVNGKAGRTAYLHAIRVTQVVDRFAEWGN